VKSQATLQVLEDVTVRPLTAAEDERIVNALDVPEPFFPGNHGGEASSCQLNDKLRRGTND
jgi:hypothetical protein